MNPTRPSADAARPHGAEPPAPEKLERRRATPRGSRPYPDWMAILRGVREGDPEALARLTGLIIRLLQRQGAYRIQESWADICQDVLLGLVDRVEQGHLRSPEAFVSYAALITRNKVADFVMRRARVTSGGRRDERHAAVPVEVCLDLAADVSGPDLLLEIDEQLRCLPRRTRAVLEAIYIQGKTYQEAARDLGIPLGTLKRVQTQGLRELREMQDRAPERRGGSPSRARAHAAA